MIHISCVPLDLRSRQVQRLLGNGYEMHRRLLKPFPTPHGDRVLFRTEEGDHWARVLVQHHQPVEWETAFDESELAGIPERKDLDLKPALLKDRRFRFLLRANPTRRLPQPGGASAKKLGPRVDIRLEPEQAAWMERKAAAGGFILNHLRITDRGAWTSLKPSGEGRRRLTHRCVEFAGVLEVTSPELFLQTLDGGIGSGKGLGFGLLSLGRA